MASRERQAPSANGRPGIRINLLGPDLLTVGGELARPGGPGQRALLIRLALAEGHLVTADRLVEDLWGDDASDSIMSTLQGYISRLRTVLGDPSRLRRTGPGYVLDADGDEVDARQFDALLTAARRVLVDDPDASAAMLGEALELWRGPALAEVTGYDWGAAAAAHLDGLRLLATEARFDALLACGRHETAVVDIQQAVVAHPLHERFVAQLMVALYRCGRQTDALREYEQARLRLVDELGLDPSPDLARHEAAILAHEPWLAAPATTPAVAATSHAIGAPNGEHPAPPVDLLAANVQLGELPAVPGPLPPAAVRHADRPFVGRSGEMTRLHDAWRAAAGGVRALVVVEGEAGVGKSRLASQFAAEIHHAAGGAVLYGRATSDSVIPYEPFVEALRGLMRPLAPAARDRLLSERPGLRAFVPVLGDTAGATGGDGHEWADPATDRYVLFETVAELMSTASQAWPVLLVVDDLQWADALTVRLLAHLLGHELAARLLVVATMRTVPRVVNVALDEALGELARDGTVVRVPVGGLCEADVAALLDATGGAATAADAASVARATRGNAFFVTEIAEHAADGSLPSSVRDSLGVRLGRLSDPATRLVRTAAVAGAVTPVDVLKGASGLADDEFLDAVDELLGSGLVVEEDGTPALAFRHGIVQQVVEDGLVLVRRRAIHARLAGTYATVPGEALRHAHHAYEAGDLVPADRMVAAALAAGREALGVFAPEEAIIWGERALARADVVSVEHRCAGLLLLSDAKRALGDRVAARAAAGEAAELARELADPSWLGAAAEAMAVARAGVGFDFGVGDEGLDEVLVEALRRLPTADVDQRSRLLAAQLSNAAATHDLYALRGLSESALHLAGEHGQHALVATAHLAARMSVWRVHLLEERLRSDFAALAAAEASGRLHLQLNAMLYLVSDLFEAGRFDESDRWFAELRHLAGKVRQPVYDAFVDFFDARTALLQGRYDDAGRLADRGLTVGAQSHGVNAEQAWAGVMFVRAWDHGELHTLVDVIERAAAAAPQFPIWRVAHASCMVAAGRLDEPVAVLQELVSDRGVEHAPDSLWFASTALLAEIARTVGDADRAAILLRELSPFSGRLTITGLGRVSLGPVDRFVGVAAITCGELDRADEALQRAVEQARRLDAAPHVARALADRAEALTRRAARGDAAAAEQALAEAASIAGDVGLVLAPLGARR